MRLIERFAIVGISAASNFFAAPEFHFNKPVGIGKRLARQTGDVRLLTTSAVLLELGAALSRVAYRAGAMTIMEQVVPHTFLRTRLFTHVFGGSPDDHKQAAATIKHACERLQADRTEGKPAIASPLVNAFHERLASHYLSS